MEHEAGFKKLIEEVESAMLAMRAQGSSFATPADGKVMLTDSFGTLAEWIRAGKGRGPEARAVAIGIAAQALQYVTDVCDEGEEDESLVDEDDLKDGEPDREATLHEDEET